MSYKQKIANLMRSIYYFYYYSMADYSPIWLLMLFIIILQITYSVTLSHLVFLKHISETYFIHNYCWTFTNKHEQHVQKHGLHQSILYLKLMQVLSTLEAKFQRRALHASMVNTDNNDKTNQPPTSNFHDEFLSLQQPAGQHIWKKHLIFQIMKNFVAFDIFLMAFHSKTT